MSNGTSSPPEQPAPAGASVQLSVNRRVGTAPAGFFFSAAASGFGVEDHYFDVRYRWEFGDPGHYTRHDTDDLPWGKYYEVDGAVTLVEDAAPPAGGSVRFLGNDRNVAYGPHACHVFETPGEYTVTCEVRKRGAAPVRATMQVAVEDPAMHFAGAATICVSPSGNFAGAPPRARAVRSFAEAVRLAERTDSENVRILFRRGEVHPTPARRGEREVRRALRRLHWGAFGEGPPPVYGPHNIFLEASDAGEACAWGLDYRGAYRADDPWGSRPVGGALATQGRAFTTVWDCDLRGGSMLLLVGKDGSDVVVGNTFGSDWHEYGIFGNRGVGHIGLCGVWLKQNPDAVIGEGMSEDEPPFYQDVAPFRCSALTGPVALNLCDLRSVGSWAGHYQPCLRLGRAPYSSATPYLEEAVMDRLRGENGAMLGTGRSGDVTYPRRYLWDKIYSVVVNEAGGSKSVFSPGVSGLGYRNVVVVLSDTPRIGGGQIDQWIRRGPSDAEDQPQIAELGLSLYNCTLVDLRSDDNYRGSMSLHDPDELAGFAFVRVENNIVHIPNREDPTETHDAPLDQTVMWQVTNEGIRYEDDPFAPLFATPPDAAAYYRPLPASPAFADAAGKEVAVDDFFGRIRGAATSRGAIDAAG